MKAYLNGEEYIFSGGGSSQEIYSTEETRIGTWIDGKPLYRSIVFSKTSKSFGTWEKVADIVIDTMVSFTGYIVTNNLGALCLTFPTGNLYPMMYESTRKPGVIVQNATDWLNKDIVCIIEYTKTTDEAES